MLAPISTRMTEFLSDPAEIDRILGQGAVKAEGISAPIVGKTREIMGMILSR